jgi:hypothetical protein
MSLVSQLQLRYDWTPNYRLVFKKPVPPELKTFKVPQTNGTKGWLVFTYEQNIPVCIWSNKHEYQKVNCIIDERLCGDTFFRAEKTGNTFIISDIWIYNSNCVYACSTFSQRYEWLPKLLNKFTQHVEGIAKLVHKSEIQGYKIIGYEEHPEEIGKHGYFIEKDDSQELEVTKLAIPDCYEIPGKGYLRVPNIQTSKYLRTKGDKFICKCIPYDDEFWDVVENIS